MPANKEARSNQSDAACTERILKLVAMDWSQTPYSVMIREFELEDRQRLYEWRQTPLYKETLAQLTQEHKQRLLEMPSTFELRKFINYGMGLAIRRLVNILSSEKTTNKDVIAAARLTAQLDGRFLKTEGDGDVPASEGQESIASELVRALERAKNTVQ